MESPFKPIVRPALGYAASLAGIAFATLAGLWLSDRWGNEPVVLLYILPVLAAAVWRGLWTALIAAVAATLAYNYWFTAPFRTLRIDSPADLVTVSVLFIVAAVTSQLAGRLREQVLIAHSHATRNATIAGFARRLLSCTCEQDIAEVAVNELARLLRCNAVVLTNGEAPRLIASSHGGTQLAPSDLAAAAVTLETGEPAGRGAKRLDLADWHFRPIAAEHGILAAAGLAREDGLAPFPESQTALLANLLDQVALALDRARFERETREVATLRERDKLRTALLMSIGADVKPSLNAIAATARAMRRSGSGDKAAASEIAAEVVKLDRYVDNLLDVEPGTDRTPITLGDLAIDLHCRTVRKDGEEVHLTPKEYALLAELAKHAGRVLSHDHLLRVVWGPAQTDQIDYLRVAIRSLRQKLENDPARPAAILNEPAVGYRLVGP